MSHNQLFDVCLPVESVTLTEDRGFVFRRGSVSHAGGTAWYRIRGLSPVLVDASLQVRIDSDAYRSVGVDVVRHWDVPAPTQPIEDQGVLDEIEDRLQSELRSLRRGRIRRDAAQEELSDAIEGLSERGGAHGLPDASRVFAGLADRCLDAVGEVSSLVERASGLVRELEARQAVEVDPNWRPRLRADLRIQVVGPAGEVPVEVRYTVPSAVWRPAWEARLVRTGEQTELSLRLVATAWQHTDEDWMNVSLRLSTARPSVVSRLPDLMVDTLSVRERSRLEATRVEASFRDQARAQASLTGGSEALPGVDDGGEVREFVVPGRWDVPSDGRARRLMVAEMRSDAVVVRRCVPSRQLAVSYVATATNHLRMTHGMPLLAGPVVLTRDDGTCVGSGRLPYVAPGERFTLGFGSEDDVLVEHRRGREVETRFARSDRTWFTSIATLTSVSGSAIDVEVVDRVPVSELPEVSIVLREPAAGEPSRVGPDADGLVRWNVRLAPGERKELVLAFAVEKPDRVVLADPW